MARRPWSLSFLAFGARDLFAVGPKSWPVDGEQREAAPKLTALGWEVRQGSPSSLIFFSCGPSP